MALQSAESNRASLRYIKEAVWGTTPVSGLTRQMRITKSSLGLSKDTATSEEIRADRMVPNIAEVAASTGGDVGWELSAFTHDDFFQAFLLSAWTLPMNGFQVKGAQVDVTGVSEIKIAGGDHRDWLAVNQWLKLEGFRNTANNLYVSISALAYTGGATVITVNQTSLVVEAGTAYSKISDAGDVILVSTTTQFGAGNTINGGGANAFAGKTLFVGQKIYVEGLGKEAATLTYDPSAAVAGNTLTVSDGEQSLIFELNTAADAIDPSHVFVAMSGDVRANFTAALMEQFVRGNLRVTAKNGVGTKEAGSIAFATTAEVGDKFTIDDGATALQFTFVASGGTGLNVNIGASASDSASNLATAINASALNVTATPSTGTVNIVNDNYTGGSIVEDVDTGTDVTTTDFSGDVPPTSVLTNHRQTGGSVAETGTVFTVTAAFSGGDANKAGFFTISALPDDDTIVVEETLTTDTNAGTLPVVIKGSHLRNSADPVSGIVKQSFSIETGFTDVSRYFLHDGLRVGSFDMSVTTGEIVTGSFSFMGARTIPNVASSLGNVVNYDVLPTTATEILNATANVGQISKNGTVLSTAVRSIEMSGDNNLRNQPAVGEKFPAGIAYGRFSLDGKITAYFATLDFYNDFRNHETVSFGFDFEDVDHNKYYFRVPAAKITTDPIAPGGVDQDIQEEMEWTAQRDPVLDTQFMMDRFSSVYPITG